VSVNVFTVEEIVVVVVVDLRDVLALQVHLIGTENGIPPKLAEFGIIEACVGITIHLETTPENVKRNVICAQSF